MQRGNLFSFHMKWYMIGNMSKDDIVFGAIKEITNKVNEAVQSQQFQNLGNQIRQSVEEATSKIKSATDTVAQNTRKATDRYRQDLEINSAENEMPRHYTNIKTSPVNTDTPFFRKHVKRSLGLGSMIAAGVGMLFTGIPALVFLFLWLISLMVNPVFLAGLIVFGGLTALLTVLSVRGGKAHRLAELYHQYGKIAGDAPILSVEKLMQGTGRSRAKVLSDLKKMMDREFFSFAEFDKDQSTLMLTSEAYQEYLSLEQQRVALEMEKVENAKAAEKARSEIADSDLPEDVKALLAEGHAYLLKVRNYNDEIPDTEIMSQKLYQLENIMKRIFEQVKRNPSSAKELRKFMTYYLPTTDKLLSSYREVSAPGATGDNILSTKQEIESAMDVINEAFENLLDKLFEDTAWDVSTDISVMKTMMAQDGLTGSELQAEKAKEKVPV